MACRVAMIGLSSLHEQVVQSSLERLADTTKDWYQLVDPKDAEFLVIDSRSLEGLGFLSTYFNDVQKKFIVVGNVVHPSSPRIHHVELPVNVQELVKLLMQHGNATAPKSIAVQA